MSYAPQTSETIAIAGVESPAFKVGYGTYHLLDKVNASEAIDSFGAAFSDGINLFDTSDNYGTELVIGRAVSAGVLPRDRIIIATKTGLGTTAFEQQRWEAAGQRYNTDPQRVRAQVDNSLRVLGDDVGIIDIYQLHVRDPNVEHVQHAELMAELMEAGKIRAWGVSNYSNEDLSALLAVCDEHGLLRPVTTQPPHNMLSPGSPANVQLAQEEGLVVLAHSPLLKGVLTRQRLGQIGTSFEAIKSHGTAEGKQTIKNIEPVLFKLIEIDRLAAARHMRLAQVALAWVLRDNGVIALTTPTNDQYLSEALDATDIEIDQDLQGAIDSLREDPQALQTFQNVTHNLVRHIRGY